MDPVVPAAVRATGSVTAAALGRYRPVGVARIGSPEDRAQAYRRLLDALAHVTNTQIIYFYTARDFRYEQRRRVVRRAYFYAAHRAAWHRYSDAQHEVHAAMLGVRLCAPAPVLAAAEAAVDGIPRPYDRKTFAPLDPEEFLTTHDHALDLRVAFLEEARRDLAYNPKPWQFLRKRRERKHRRQTD